MTSPALTCVCGVAARPLTDVTIFEVLSVGPVGLVGLHDGRHVPTDVVTRLATCAVFAGSGLTTVSVYGFDTDAPPATVTDCVHAVPAAAPVAHDQPWPDPLYVVFAGTVSDRIVVPDCPPVLVT